MDTDHARLMAAVGRDAPPWLAPWLDWLDGALHREVLRLRARYEPSVDELRGLYVSDEQVDRFVRRTGEPDGPETSSLDGRLVGLLAEAALPLGSPIAEVSPRFGLADADVVALVLCLAPEVDLGYQAVYAYLNDDVSRRLPTVDLCRRVSGAQLQPDSPSVVAGLVEVQRQAGSPLWRSAGLVLAEPVRRHLLATRPSGRRPPDRGRGLTVLAVRLPLDGDAEARAWADRQGRDLVRAADPARLSTAVLTARLTDAALHVPGELHGLGDDAGPAEVRRVLRELVDAGVPVLLSAPAEVADRLPLDGIEHERRTVATPDAASRERLWSTELLRHGFTVDDADLAEIAAVYRLSAAQIRSAVSTIARGGVASRPALRDAARRTGTAGLRGVAQRVDADYTWEDLVLPSGTMRRLRQLEGAIRHRDEVFGSWAFGRLAGGHTSVRALFAGPSGTGKTMAASVLGSGLGMDVFRVDLSSVVSKYIGETEKNLERILGAAEHGNAILFFDEADALFGKRSEVKDAHDRYANIEVAFLLQRLETFDGIVVLATNLATNLDEAFSRRLHFTIDFPAPDEAARLELWRRAFPPAAPVAGDVDVDFLASRFVITGGEIRAASLMAAFLAATDRAPISMTHVVLALARLRRQQGRIPSAGEFGAHLRAANDGAA